MSRFFEWLIAQGATAQALYIAAAGFLIIGLGFACIWLGTRGDEYRGVRRRWRKPDPYDRDPHTGEFLVPPGTFDAPPPLPSDHSRPFSSFVPADMPDTRAEVRHRLEDTQGMTTNLGAYAAAVRRYSARTMVPCPRPVGEGRRNLSPEWREALKEGCDDGDNARSA